MSHRDPNYNPELSEDSLKKNPKVWLFCFHCCTKNTAQEQPELSDKYDSAADYLVEKLLITKAPLALFGTEEDITEAYGIRESGSEVFLTPEREKRHEHPFKVSTIEARVSQMDTPSIEIIGDMQSEREYSQGSEASSTRSYQKHKRLSKISEDIKLNGKPINYPNLILEQMIPANTKPDTTLQSMVNERQVRLTPTERSIHREIGSNFLNQYSTVFLDSFKDLAPKDPNPLNPSNRYIAKQLNVPEKWHKKILQEREHKITMIKQKIEYERYLKQSGEPDTRPSTSIGRTDPIFSPPDSDYYRRKSPPSAYPSRKLPGYYSRKKMNLLRMKLLGNTSDTKITPKKNENIQSLHSELQNELDETDSDAENNEEE